MRQILLLSVWCFSLSLWSATGDTTVVASHQKTDMTWYGSYKDWAVFPDGNTSYHKIIMEYTMGCASGGCSDWDYTTRINLLYNTGNIDSTVERIDTISFNPLVIDTTWRTFEVKEPYELAKVITPYANGFSNNWSHTFRFDVTDYYPLMKDSVEIEAFYSGWSSGFSATVTFYMIEGTPPREVTSIQNLYRGAWNYIDANQFNTQNLPAKNITLNSNTQMSNVRVNISGHGFVNSLNCAEFCRRDYYVKSGGQTVYTQAMWRDDCGLNAIFPQPGTWLFDRANWCPGDKSLTYDHDMTGQISNGQLDIDMDIETYSYTVPSGEVPANYIVSAQLIEYKNPAHQIDAELEDIIYPSPEDENKRFNPVCGAAAIKIRNKGATSLTSCRVIYGVHGADFQSYNWTGNLGLMESEIVELPMAKDSSWLSWYHGTEFYAKLDNLNGGSADEVPFNNTKEVEFAPVPQYPAKMVFYLRTNGAANETHWSLEKADGTLIASGDNLTNNTNYTENLDLTDGCYVLTISDRDKDGLSFFANSDGTGSARLQNDGGSFFVKSLQNNFGTELKQYFTVGYGIGLPEYTTSDFDFSLFPNPASKGAQLEMPAKPGLISIKLFDLNGKVVYQFEEDNREQLYQHQLDLNNLSPGLYQVTVSNGSFWKTKKLIVH